MTAMTEALLAHDRDALQQSLLAWYDAHRRDLPWRGDKDPYHVLVSEVMLQQTGVDRVIPKYHEFLARFPTLQSLAQASAGDVLRAWQGLGYNRRALNLKRLAQVVVAEYGGQLPTEADTLRPLPGIGRYTAHAVACFAYGRQLPVVDTNVRRILSVFTGRDLSEKEAWEVAREMLPEGRAEDWNQALMDYGALVYKAARRRSPSVRPFTSTNRFWRGRIIDVLRHNASISMDELQEALPYPGRDEERVRGLVRTLHEEGLLTYDTESEQIRLPS